MPYPRIIWRDDYFRIIERGDFDWIPKGKIDDQPAVMEHRGSDNAMGGETWLPLSDHSTSAKAMIRAILEMYREGRDVSRP